MIRVTRTFSFAYDGLFVRELPEGTVLADDDEAAAVALKERWGETVAEVLAEVEEPPDPGRRRSR